MPLGPGDVDVWCCSPAPDDPERCLAMLSADERARRFANPADRARFVVTRALVRTVLSRYARVEPAAWRFDYEPGGRPRAAGGPWFSVSHTGGLSLCAVTRTSEAIGVDVERSGRAARVVALADRYFSPDEAADVRAASSEAARRARFFAYWTVKEAYLKARGTGLGARLDRCRFELSAGVASLCSHDRESAAFRFSFVDVGADFVVALALRSPAAPLRPRVAWADPADVTPARACG